MRNWTPNKTPPHRNRISRKRTRLSRWKSWRCRRTCERCRRDGVSTALVTASWTGLWGGDIGKCDFGGERLAGEKRGLRRRNLHANRHNSSRTAEFIHDIPPSRANDFIKVAYILVLRFLKISTGGCISLKISTLGLKSAPRLLGPRKSNKSASR